MRKKILYYEYSCGRWGGWEFGSQECGRNIYIVESSNREDILEYAVRYGYRAVFVA